MQITNIEVVQNDAAYDLNFTLQDYAGNAVNLSGASISLKVQKENSNAIKFTGSMSIVSAAAGTCKYTVAAGDFDEAGKFAAEIQVTIGSQVLTWTGIIIKVLPELPKS